MNYSIKTVIACAVVLAHTAAFSETINLESFSTDTGECTLTAITDLQKASLGITLSPFKSFTIIDTPIHKHRGPASTTGNVIPPSQTVMCLAKDGDKMLVTTLDPLNKSCGWVDTNNLKTVKKRGSIIGVSMEPCGEIEPIEVGEFCAKIAKNKDLTFEAQKLTRFCNI